MLLQLLSSVGGGSFLVVDCVSSANQQRETSKPASCNRNSLLVAEQTELRNVAFPGIGTGSYNYPKPQVAAIAVREVRAFLELHELPQEVVFVVFDEASFPLYEQALR